MRPSPLTGWFIVFPQSLHRAYSSDASRDREGAVSQKRTTSRGHNASLYHSYFTQITVFQPSPRSMFDVPFTTILSKVALPYWGVWLLGVTPWGICTLICQTPGNWSSPEYWMC